MTIPPGIAFLAPTLPYLLVPPALVYLADRLLRSAVDVTLPSLVLFAAYVVSLPLAIVTNTYWYQSRVAQRAAAAGAVMPPAIESKKLLGLDILQQSVRDWDSHYNGTESFVESFRDLPDQICTGYRFMEWVSEYGFTYNLRALLQDRVSAITLLSSILLTTVS